MTPSPSTDYRYVRLRELARLEANWDSYGAPPLTDAALRTADAVVFVPTGAGGVQVELHAAGVDVEVTISDTGEIEGVYICGNVELDHDTPE